MKQFCGVTYKARYYFSRKQLLRFYNAYINSRISYGILIYGNTTKTHLTEILKVQKRILRAIFFKRPSDSMQKIIDEFKIPTVFDLLIREIINLVFLHLRGQYPLKILNNSHQTERRITRQSIKGLMVPISAKTEAKRKSIEVKSLKAYNFLTVNNLIPENLKDMRDSAYKRFSKSFFETYILGNSVLYDLLI